VGALMGKIIQSLRGLWSRRRRGPDAVTEPARVPQPSDGATPASPPPVAPAPAAGKQAVVIVHGMGEQRPMDTLKGFVRTVWEDDPAIAAMKLPNPRMVWSKPDGRTGSLELRRITTRESVVSTAWPAGVRTDFYELYWADLTAGSTWGQLVAWVRYLLLRRLRRVPANLRSAWFALWLASLLIFGLALAGILPDSFWKRLGPVGDWHWLLVPAAAGLGAVVHDFATRTFGRVVRYTRADPDNIAARAAVRQRGLELLRALHKGSEYSRVVVVAHSLGTILAYDLIGYYWAERAAARSIDAPGADFDALCAVERAAAAIDDASPESFPAAGAALRKAQTALRHRLASRAASSDEQDHGRWLISDFVTFGSPLTHAEVLIASSGEDLEARKRAREMPTSPPYRETLDPDVRDAALKVGGLPVDRPPKESQLMSFREFTHDGRWMLHHAAPFAAVRWTNVHDPARFIYQGDVIGGPLAGTLGRGIHDVDLRSLRGQASRFSHTRYWDPDQDPRQLAAVRAAINLLDE
jgi:hypothetical protein